MGYFVYIAECADGSWYTGWTTDPLRRIRTHNEGRGARYTRSRLPVRLIFARELVTKQEAMHWEYMIKQLPRARKEEVVRTGILPESRKKRAQDERRMGKIYCLMGKSASGKDHIFEALLQDERLRGLKLERLVIYTTRPKRTKEEDGVAYHFTDEEGMKRLEEQGRVIEKRCYDTVMGPWYYFTADDGTIDLSAHSYLVIGTPEAYRKLRKYFGPEKTEALYVETDDGIRLERALRRERSQAAPQYEEMCRRFLADQKDFSGKKLKQAGIERTFPNNSSLDECISGIVSFLLDNEQNE